MTEHIHRWRVECLEPETVQLKARCECGATRTYPAEPEVTRWGKMVSQRPKKVRVR